MSLLFTNRFFGLKPNRFNDGVISYTVNNSLSSDKAFSSILNIVGEVDYQLRRQRAFSGKAPVASGRATYAATTGSPLSLKTTILESFGLNKNYVYADPDQDPKGRSSAEGATRWTFFMQPR